MIPVARAASDAKSVSLMTYGAPFNLARAQAVRPTVGGGQVTCLEYEPDSGYIPISISGAQEVA